MIRSASQVDLSQKNLSHHVSGQIGGRRTLPSPPAPSHSFKERHGGFLFGHHQINGKECMSERGSISDRQRPSEPTRHVISHWRGREADRRWNVSSMCAKMRRYILRQEKGVSPGKLLHTIR